MSFFESIKNAETDYEKEIIKLRQLFEVEKHDFYSLNEYKPASYYVNARLFRNMKLSYQYINLDDMIYDAFNTDFYDKKYINYIEILLSIDKQVNYNNMYEGNREPLLVVFNSIKKLVNIVLDKNNLEAKTIKDDVLGNIVCISVKDALLDETICTIEDDNLINTLVKYRLKRYEGNIQEKENMLIIISKHVEPFLKNNKLRDKNKRLYSNTGFLLNNLDLRHENKNVNDVRFYNETLKNREEWLNKLFSLILLVLNSDKEDSIDKEISSLKSSVE